MRQYTEICKDIFENILDENIQRHKQAEIARNFDIIKKQLVRKEKPKAQYSKHPHCQKPNAISTLHLRSEKEPRGSKNFAKLHQSTKDLVKDIE